MDLATGAVGALLPKLAELLKEEYNLEEGLRKDVEFLQKEIRVMDPALRRVARVRHDRLVDEPVKIWTDDIRELSYEMEDAIDRFLIRAESWALAPNPDVGFVRKVISYFKKRKTAHQIADAIKEIKEQVQEVACRYYRYQINWVNDYWVSKHTFDPRIPALFKDKREIIGIDGPRDELIEMLTSKSDDVSNDKRTLNILSIFRFGGLGKTTLLKAVYDKLLQGFTRKAFVSVGQDPDVKKVLMDILLQLDEASCSNIALLDECQLIQKLRGLLKGTRYVHVYNIFTSMISQLNY
jgi:hypothetical protein